MKRKIWGVPREILKNPFLFSTDLSKSTIFVSLHRTNPAMSNPAFRIPTVRQSLDEEHNLPFGRSYT
jgi:hypothetical protein